MGGGGGGVWRLEGGRERRRKCRERGGCRLNTHREERRRGDREETWRDWRLEKRGGRRRKGGRGVKREGAGAIQKKATVREGKGEEAWRDKSLEERMGAA